MRKRAAQIFALLLSVAFLAGCNKQPQTAEKQYNGTMDNAVIWCTSSSQKVLQDKDESSYDDIKTDGLNIVAAKGEYEAAQVIISADKDLQYTVKASELTSGENKLAASNVEIFHEKYIRVSEPFGSFDAGMYPDALVPAANIKEAGENFVLAGENQGLYVRYYIPSDQPAGIYRGTVTVTIGGRDREIPVTLNVYDVTVSETNHAQSVFLNEWYFYKGELDSTQDMFDKYNEALFEYRLNPNYILYDFDVASDEGIAAYVEKAYEYMQNDLCSTISLPYATEFASGKDIDTSSLHIEESDSRYVSDRQYDFTSAALSEISELGRQEVVDDEVMTKYIRAFAEKSFSEGYNMPAKLVTYFRLIDETKDSLGYSRVKMISVIFRNTANAAAAEILENKEQIKADYPQLDAKAKENGFASADEFIEAVAESVRTLYHVATIAANTDYEEILPFLNAGCPLFDAYDTEEGRAKYYMQTQKWWYGCVAPEPPYATYRIDDSMLSPRMVSWMQAEYGVIGNLYWATTIYAENVNWTYQEIYDYYSGNAERYPGANGDGFLFYPGAQYGVDGPVASMRLEAIRDGLEEYELLYALQNSYNENKISGDTNGDGVNDAFVELMETLVSDLYDGTIVTATEEAFNTARLSLLELSALNDSPAGFCILKEEDDGYGTIEITFGVNTDVEVTLSEESCGTLSAPETAGALKSYTVSVDMKEKNGNTLIVNMQAGGQTYTYEKYLGGKVQIHSVDDTVTAEDLAAVNSSVETAFDIADANSIAGADWTEGKVLRAALSERINFTKQQSFTLQGSMIAGIDSSADSLMLSMFADSGRTVSVILVGEKGETALISITFSGKAENVKISLGSVNWNKIGQVKQLRFNVATGDSALTVCLKDVVVYGK